MILYTKLWHAREDMARVVKVFIIFNIQYKNVYKSYFHLSLMWRCLNATVFKNDAHNVLLLQNVLQNITT
jgi:hypothetical protein